MASHHPILYSFRRCPYAMRARMALHVSGRCCELREIVLSDKPPAFLAASRKGTVPVLLCPDGRVIDESLDIMFWALDGHDPERWLLPTTGDADAMRTVIAACDGPFKRHLDGYKYAPRTAPETALEARAAASPYLLGLDARLTGQPYLFGARVTLADIAIFPFVRQFANVDPAWFERAPWPKLAEWLAGFTASPRFAAIMTRYPKWQAGDQPTLFAGTPPA